MIPPSWCWPTRLISRAIRLNQRSYRSHTLFVRAVDDQGARDQDPAKMSFTATTLVPIALLGPTYRSNTTGAQQAPTTVTIDYSGEDPDYSGVIPAQFRYMWKKATFPAGTPEQPYITEEYVYLQYFEEIIDFGSDEWEDWMEFPSDEMERRIVIDRQDIRDENDVKIGYFFAVQVKDVAGAVSVGRDYMQQVGNFTLKVFRPFVELFENSSLFQTNVSYRKDVIAAYQPISFSWTADVSTYLGEVTAYRYGWDLVNPDNPFDENWAIPPGVSPQHLFAPEKEFDTGNHVFTLTVTDNSAQTAILQWALDVIPYMDRDAQEELLIIDGISDASSGAWVSSTGEALDEETFRDDYWKTTLDPVQDFVWENHRFADVDLIDYEDIYNYKVIVFPTRNGNGQVMASFRTLRLTEQFIWLEPYQRRGGNLLFCGEVSQFGFLRRSDNYMVPFIFNTTETFLYLDDKEYVVGFGTRELTDGTIVERGPLQYPYKTAGLAVLDWTSPDVANIYNRPEKAKHDRAVGCVGLKALVLDDAFRTEYDVAPGATGIPDTLFSDPIIDWKDEANWSSDLLEDIYTWGSDEFYDANITSTRPTPYQLQLCPEAPSGFCVEPMFRGVARFDWLREKRWAEGEVDWPESRSSYDDLDEICGSMALTSYEGVPDRSALTNDKTFGFISYKMFAEKDWGKADIYWGFDPYRFDSQSSRQAIHWVLRYFGLQVNTPDAK